MLDKLETMVQRHSELGTQLSAPDVHADQERYAKLSKEFSDLDPIIAACHAFRELTEQAEEAEAMSHDDDPELRQMAKEEMEQIKTQIQTAEHDLKLMLLPKDPNDGKNVILEIRAGTGGDEAALFSSDLWRMYTRFAELKRWKVEILSSSPTDLGGFKEVIATISGKDAYSALKFESGVHRVQRIPTTETGGRIHTSACTVAILAEADEVDVVIQEKDLRIDVYRSSGPGGQSVNTTDSAVRITHIPTGLVVTCQDEKSQHKNKAKAMKVLKARLYDLEQQAADKERSQERRSQVGSGDRSERIRTYNFPQSRITDHRINLSLHKLDQVMEGQMEEIVSSLAAHYQAELLSGT
ncbi:MAG: peptide chain release factor 1 [Magnetococcales bacterium]|nr:peptide chain release factor 1 [Magnetococcales bacterium]